jgi:hypothetical protein
MAAKTLIQIGGIFHFGMVLLHIMFPKILHWKTELELLLPINKAVYLILSKLLMYSYAVICFVSLYYWSELLNSEPGNVALAAIGVFWLIRAYFQIKYFKVFDEALAGRAKNVSMLLLWLFAAALYLVPLVCNISEIR